MTAPKAEDTPPAKCAFLVYGPDLRRGFPPAPCDGPVEAKVHRVGHPFYHAFVPPSPRKEGG